MRRAAMSGAAICVVVACLATRACAGQFSELVDFGDSLSDAGNTFALTGQPASPPNYNGRSSNGPVWVEDLAPLLGLAVPTASMAGGPHATDFAYSWARTGGGAVPSVKEQVAAYLHHATVTGRELFTIEGGADDFAAGVTDPTVPANAISDDIQSLISLGGRSFVVLNLPPLGLTPLFRGTPLQKTATALSEAYDATLAADLAALRAAHPNVNIIAFDLDGLLQQIIANPAAYGFTNVTGPALSGSPPMAAAGADHYLFWDEAHPTAAAHELLAQRVAAELPEPGLGWVLLVVAYGLARRRRLAS